MKERRRIALACCCALLAFAANSLLARSALGNGLIDAGTFTVVRIVSGAVLLSIVVSIRRGRPAGKGSWSAGAALAAYAAAFSFSYVRIGAALGALVLFPTVKLALLVWGRTRGEHPSKPEWLGASAALAGLVTLTLPGVGRADPGGVALMSAAGLAWAGYTIAGRGMSSPLNSTTGNFIRASVLAAPLPLVGFSATHATSRGMLLAVVSGALASGLGYVLWYYVVPELSAIQLGLAQISVPVLASMGAVALLGEHLNTRSLLAAAMIFAGIGLALSGSSRPSGR